MDIWTIRSAGDDERRVTHDGIEILYTNFPSEMVQTAEFSWRPDGKRIAYCSKAGGAQNIWTIDDEGLDKVQITDNTDRRISMACPLFSADGNRIAFTSMIKESATDVKKWYRVSVVDGLQSVMLTESVWLLRLLGWSRSGDGMIVAKVDKAYSYPYLPASIELFHLFVDRENHQARIAEVHDVYLASVRLSPDGGTVAYVSKHDSRNTLNLLSITDGSVRKLVRSLEPRSYVSNLRWSQDGRKLFYTKQISRSLLHVLGASR